MVSPSTMRRAVHLAVETGMGGTAAACRALGLARSSFYRTVSTRTDRVPMSERIIGLSRNHPRYGYRRITALLRRAGLQINAKRVQRVRRQHGLQVRKRQRRMRRLGLSTAVRQRADASFQCLDLGNQGERSDAQCSRCFPFPIP